MREYRNILANCDNSTKYPNLRFLPKDQKDNAKQIPDGIGLKTKLNVGWFHVFYRVKLGKYAKGIHGQSIIKIHNRSNCSQLSGGTFITLRIN